MKLGTTEEATDDDQVIAIVDVVQKNEKNNAPVTAPLSTPVRQISEESKSKSSKDPQVDGSPIETHDEDVTLSVSKSRAKDELILTGDSCAALSIPSTPDSVFLGSGNMDRSDVESTSGLVERKQIPRNCYNSGCSRIVPRNESFYKFQNFNDGTCWFEGRERRAAVEVAVVTPSWKVKWTVR